MPETFKVNPFKLSGLTMEARASLIEEMLVVAARLTQLQATRIKDMVLAKYLSGEEVALDQIVEKLKEDGRKSGMLMLKLSAIWRVIGEEPKEFWDSIFGTNTCDQPLGPEHEPEGDSRILPSPEDLRALREVSNSGQA